MCHKSCVTSHVSCVMRHVSCVRFQVSGVMSNLFFLLLFWSKWWSLSVEGLLSTEPTWLILSFFFLIMECCSSMIELTKKIIPPTVNLSIIMVKNAWLVLTWGRVGLNSFRLWSDKAGRGKLDLVQQWGVVCWDYIWTDPYHIQSLISSAKPEMNLVLTTHILKGIKLLVKDKKKLHQIK